MGFNIEDYYESVQQNIGDLYTFKQLDSGYIQVRTPYHYPDGSVIDVYIKGTTVTDLGETARVLGIDLDPVFLTDVAYSTYIKNNEIFIKDVDYAHKGIVSLTEVLIKTSFALGILNL